VTAIRLVILVAVWVLGTSTLSLAQEDDAEQAQPPATLPAEPPASEDGTQPLLVPDVRGLPLVFAKGVLEDAGFAWKVDGKPQGYAVNLVASQKVAPGTKVVDTGAPVIVLRLRENPAYDELGMPMNESPYPGTKLVLAEADGAEAGAEPDASTEPDKSADASGDGASAADESADASTDGEAETAEPGDAGSSAGEAAGETQPAETVDVELAGAEDAAADEESTRPPAFNVPGAPAEPLDDIALPERARQLQAWANDLDKLGAAALDHYAYQHAWIVTGAGFGWWRGAEALRTLIRVDETMQSRFDVGRENEAQARAALAEVERKSAQ
jgi:hypothetical protein